MPRWVSSRGGWLVFNLLFAAFLCWLIAPLFGHRSVSPAVFGRYSYGYAAFLGAWSVMVLTYVLAAVAGDRQANRRLALSTVAVIAVAESAARVRGLGGYYTASTDVLRQPAPFIHFAGQPNATFDGPPGMGGSDEERRITLNSLGLRGDVPPMPKNEYRVIVIGGSTVFNGAPLAKSIPGYLETWLRQERPDARAYNWGVTSFNSGQELTLLAHLGPRYQPDFVIEYGGINDLFSPYVYDPRPGYPIDWMVNETGLRMARGGASFNSRMAAVLLSSRLATVLFREPLVSRLTDLERLRTAAGYGSDQWRQQIAATYLQNLVNMCAVSRGLGAKFAAFLQPAVFTKKTLAGGEPVMLDRPSMQSHVAHMYTAMRQLGVELNRSGCTFHDVSDALDDVPGQVFWDFAHVTNQGNETIAKRIYDVLKAAHPDVLRTAAAMPHVAPSSGSGQSTYARSRSRMAR